MFHYLCVHLIACVWVVCVYNFWVIWHTWLSRCYNHSTKVGQHKKAKDIHVCMHTQTHVCVTCKINAREPAQHNQIKVKLWRGKKQQHFSTQNLNECKRMAKEQACKKKGNTHVYAYLSLSLIRCGVYYKYTRIK